jgi:hypothetical protein
MLPGGAPGLHEDASITSETNIYVLAQGDDLTIKPGEGWSETYPCPLPPGQRINRQPGLSQASRMEAGEELPRYVSDS